MTKDTHKAREDILKYEAVIGDTIDYVAEQAVRLSQLHHKTVTFTFNDVSLTVDESSTPEGVVLTYRHAREEQAERYRNSPEGKAAAAKIAAEAAVSQKLLNALVDSDLDEAIKGGMTPLVNWAKEFASLANEAEDYRGDEVLTKLAAAGFRANECAGTDFVKGDKNIMGRYIIGQVMACMDDSGPFGKMPPHPITMKFADDYNAMPDAPKAKADGKRRPPAP